MEKTESQLAISCHQVKLQVPGLGYIKLSCRLKGSCGNPQTIQAAAKTKGCSPQIDSKTLLLKTPSTKLIEHGEIQLVTTKILYLYVLVCLVQKSTLNTTFSILLG